MRDDRAQAFTLEGFVASVVVLTAILFALQSVVLTPTTGGTVDKQVQQQLRTEAHDILVASANNFSVGANGEDDDNDLRYVVLYWNGSEKGEDDTWTNAIDKNIGYGSREPLPQNETLFGEALNSTFTQRGRVYNVILEYRNASDPTKSRTVRMVYRGVPSDNAITTTYTVTLFDNDTLTGIARQPAEEPDCTELPIEGMKPDFGPDDWDARGPDCYFAIPEAAAFDDDDQSEVHNDAASSPGTEPYCTTNGGSIDCADEKQETSDSPIYNVVEIRVIIW